MSGVLRCLCATMATVLLACGSARKGEPFTPAPQLDATEALGERAFMKHCNQCHPEGAGGIGPAINNKPLPRIAIHTQIRLGAGEMPSFGEEHLSDEEVEAITAYLSQLRSPTEEK